MPSHAHLFKKALRRLYAGSLLCIGLASLTTQAWADGFRLGTMGARVDKAFYPSPRTNQPHYLRIMPSYLAGPYPFTPGRPIDIRQRDAAGVEHVLARFAIPAAIQEPLVMLYTGPVQIEEGLSVPYGAIILDDSRAGLPPESLRLFNASQLPIAFRIQGTKPTTLAPGKSATERFKLAKPGDAENLPLIMAYKSPLDSQWTRFGDEQMTVLPGARYFIFLMPQPDAQGRLKAGSVMVIEDRAEKIRPVPPIL